MNLHSQHLGSVSTPSFVVSEALRAEEPQSGWLGGIAKGFSDTFAAFTARFKSQPKNLSSEGVEQKSMFSSLGNWASSFSLRDWIPKGISFKFFSQKEDAFDARDSRDRDTLARVDQPVSLFDWFSLIFFKPTSSEEYRQRLQNAFPNDKS